jgi:hypothetical protein
LGRAPSGAKAADVIAVLPDLFVLRVRRLIRTGAPARDGPPAARRPRRYGSTGRVSPWAAP